MGSPFDSEQLFWVSSISAVITEILENVIVFARRRRRRRRDDARAMTIPRRFLRRQPS